MPRPLRAAATLLAAAALVLVSGCDSLAIMRGRVSYPKIVPVKDVPDVTAERKFRFENRTYAIRVEIDGGVYAGARRAVKKAVKSGSFEDIDWIPDYYRAFIDEPHEKPVYEGVLRETRRIREEEGLDDDRYAELIAAFVQSLDYKVDPEDLSPKFPVETLAQDAGDCDDKSLLLAALLAEEGYNVSILFFEPEKHVGVGLRADEPRYPGTEYAFVETTRPSMVGFVPERLGEGEISLESKPRVIRIGTGEKSYGSGDQVAYVLRALAEAERRQRSAAADLQRLETERASLGTRVEARKREVQQRSKDGYGQGYLDAIKRYNSLADEYNRLVSRINPIAEEHNRLVDVQKHVWAHQDDRPGVYEWVRKNGL